MPRPEGVQRWNTDEGTLRCYNISPNTALLHICSIAVERSTLPPASRHATFFHPATTNGQRRRPSKLYGEIRLLSTVLVNHWNRRGTWSPIPPGRGGCQPQTFELLQWDTGNGMTTALQPVCPGKSTCSHTWYSSNRRKGKKLWWIWEFGLEGLIISSDLTPYRCTTQCVFWSIFQRKP